MNDKDTIYRQAAIDTIRAFYDEYIVYDNGKSIEDLISELPSAEPQRKKGRWVWLSSTYDRSPCEMRFWCSECHHETIVHTNGTSEPWEKFCPNCGAEMREGEV